MTKQDEQAFQNPSYDKSLPTRTRLTDFIGKYHIMLNGVKPHEVYERFEEDGGGLCCSEHKVEILDFVDQLLQTQREEIREQVEGLETTCTENHGCNDDMCIRRTAKNQFKNKILELLKKDL